MLRLRAIAPVDQRMAEAVSGESLEPACLVSFEDEDDCSFLRINVRVRERDSDDEMIAVARQEAMAMLRRLCAE